MKTDYEILDSVERAGKPVPVDALRAFIGDGADAKIADMRQRKLLRTVSTGFFESGKAAYALGPAAGDILQATRSKRRFRAFEVGRDTVALIISLAALFLSGLSIYLQFR